MENGLKKLCEYGEIFEQYLRPLTFPTQKLLVGFLP
jgi:hypothetical protein